MVSCDKSSLRLKLSSIASGVNGSITLGGWIGSKWKLSWGTEVTQVGSMGEDPIRGLVDNPPKLILILEINVKLI